MSFVTSSGQERGVRIAAVVLLHAAFGAAFLSMGGYQAIRVLVEPTDIQFVPDTPVPPEPVPTPPETNLDKFDPDVPKIDITIRDNPTPLGPVVTTKNDTGVDSGPVTVVPDPGPATIVPPVVHKAVTTYALFDPRYDHYQQPNYPGSARALGIEGRVTLEVTIGVDGRVMDARLINSSGSDDLDTAALKHAKRYWRFKPATEDGKPVISTLKRNILFKLDVQRG